MLAQTCCASFPWVQVKARSPVREWLQRLCTLQRAVIHK